MAILCAGLVLVIESTLDDPRQVLSAQQFRARGEAVAQMKADGVAYKERLELLEDVTYPKPLSDLLDGPTTSTARASLGAGLFGFAQVGGPRHVRAGADAPRVRRLLRAVPLGGTGAALPGEAYKALRETVPDEAKTEELTDLIEWLGEVIARSTPACWTSGWAA